MHWSSHYHVVLTTNMLNVLGGTFHRDRVRNEVISNEYVYYFGGVGMNRGSHNSRLHIENRKKLVARSSHHSGLQGETSYIGSNVMALGNHRDHRDGRN